jgi:hypothetical protein
VNGAAAARGSAARSGPGTGTVDICSTTQEVMLGPLLTDHVTASLVKPRETLSGDACILLNTDTQPWRADSAQVVGWRRAERVQNA